MKYGWGRRLIFNVVSVVIIAVIVAALINL